MDKKAVPVYMYSLGVFIMVLTGHIRVIQGQENCKVPGSSSSICSQLDLQGSKFNISGLQPGHEVAGCQCILTFNDSSYVGGPIAINVTANIPAGCQHEVYFIHNSTTMRYSCKVFERMYTFNVSVQDNLQMILVSGEKSTGGFQLCFKISTEPELDMRLVCNETNTTGMIPSTTTTAIMSDTTVSSIPSTTTTAIISDTTVSSIPSTTTTTEIMSDTTVSSINGMTSSTTTTEITSDTARTSINGMTPSTTTTQIMPDTAVPKSTQTTNDERVTDQNTNLTSTDENGVNVKSKLGVIVGGSVGGIAVIIVIIIIIVCVRRKRRKDKTSGDKYAVVNKGGKMINNDKRSEQFKIGPTGDQYTVVNKERKKNNNEAGKQFKIGPSGDQYAVVNKMGRGTTNNA